MTVKLSICVQVTPIGLPPSVRLSALMVHVREAPTHQWLAWYGQSSVPERATPISHATNSPHPVCTWAQWMLRAMRAVLARPGDSTGRVAASRDVVPL